MVLLLHYGQVYVGRTGLVLVLRRGNISLTSRRCCFTYALCLALSFVSWFRCFHALQLFVIVLYIPSRTPFVSIKGSTSHLQIAGMWNIFGRSVQIHMLKLNDSNLIAQSSWGLNIFQNCFINSYIGDLFGDLVAVGYFQNLIVEASEFYNQNYEIIYTDFSLFYLFISLLKFPIFSIYWLISYESKYSGNGVNNPCRFGQLFLSSIMLRMIRSIWILMFNKFR